ncbi:MAG: sugar phosphate nucleotidyltransferase [Bacillota bacterium]|nr:sugar phosphate nucleotidyltransferase [Bacillota bacterium]
MKAVIMAGGEGSRLRPITCDTPKPMVPLLGKPVMEYIIALLKNNGITDIAATLQYLPRVITDYFDDGSRFGVNLRYFIEEKPLGTAGSVKNCETFLDGDFLVISGDAVCDFDLKSAIKWHKSKNAAVTIVLTHIHNPLEYGVVMTDDTGKVTRFVEKPAWNEVFADTVNTGIYIVNSDVLNLIPGDTVFDFSKDLFPKLMNDGVSIYAYDAEGYWCDIGDINAYTASNIDSLNDKFNLYTKHENNTNKFKGCKINEPVYFGDGVNIGEGSTIGPNVIIGDFTSVGKNCRLSHSIIHSYSRIGDNCELQGAVTCHAAVLKKGVSLQEGSVIGANCIIGDNVQINPNVKIWNNKTIPEHAHITTNVVWGNSGNNLFDEEEIAGEAGIDITPEMCCRLGAALASLKKGFKCGIMCDGSATARLIGSALASGASFSGANVFRLGKGFSALLSYSIHAYGLDGGFFISERNGLLHIEIKGEDSISIPRYIERKLQNAFYKDDFSRASYTDIKATQSIDGIDLLYINALTKSINTPLVGEVYIGCKSQIIRSTIVKALTACGIMISETEKLGIPHFYIDNSGTWLSAKDEELEVLSSDFTGALTLLSIIEKGKKKVSYFYNRPSAFDRICEEYGVKYEKVLVSPADNSDKNARHHLYDEPALYDSLFAVMRIMESLSRNKISLKKFSERLPRFFIKKAEVWIPANRKSYVIRKLQSKLEGSAELIEGIRFEQKNAEVLLVPKKKGGFNLRIEASNTETAEELCNFYKREIYRLADNAEP